MTKVAVIGNAGGGKSTLCRRLSQARNIEVFPIDRIQWKPGWQPTPLEELKQKHQEISDVPFSAKARRPRRLSDASNDLAASQNDLADSHKGATRAHQTYRHVSSHNTSLSSPFTT